MKRAKQNHSFKQEFLLNFNLDGNLIKVSLKPNQTIRLSHDSLHHILIRKGNLVLLNDSFTQGDEGEYDEDGMFCNVKDLNRNLYRNCTISCKHYKRLYFPEWIGCEELPSMTCHRSKN